MSVKCFFSLVYWTRYSVQQIAVSASVSDVPQLDVALVTVKVTEIVLNLKFEQPNGYTFSVKEGEGGLSVGFVKVSAFILPLTMPC